MKYLLAILFLIISGCSSIDSYKKMDDYCHDECFKIYEDELEEAKWHGNDDKMKIIRCACYLKYHDGPTIHYIRNKEL